ncbi:NTF2 fold immunity protein [Pseudochryseolinea flava]|uniref:NTF2 fold domain-containing protein n=1 Tax=Pseudochryseolinea flava TaxID=2059302 RepID=A0A364XWU3_9BACT|nr:NTF2 fold immunity protein [Pseudochryseolinea flava]RAV98888.1 hypothetical protein DQQ10_21545 [Pseudochryseolinea flava]
MKNKVSFVILICFCAIVACQKDPRYLGKERAQKRLEKILSDTSYVLIRGDTLIKNEKSAITIAEAALFEFYGEDKIRSEQPYEAYLINGYWVINGTLPKGADGGTFEVVINAMDGRFVQLGHSR